MSLIDFGTRRVPNGATGSSELSAGSPLARVGKVCFLRRNGCPWFWRALTAFGLILNAPAMATAGDPPAPVPPSEAPINIFLNNPADLSALWKGLAKPDFVVLRGDEYAKLKAAPASASPATPWAYATSSVAVDGQVTADLATLSIELAITLAVEGPAWVPIRLDAQTLTIAREESRELPLRAAENGAWQVELSGRGRHVVKVGLLVPIRQTGEGKRLELIIPEAPSTRFAINIPQRVSEANAGPGEPLALSSIKETGHTRLSGDLTPRAKLELAWRVEQDSSAQLPPLLVAQGDIAVDLEAGSFRTRASWAIRSLRGTTKSLELRLDPADDVLELELDGQPPPAGTERVGDATRLTIPLAEPLGPGQERKLVMSTRRTIPTDAPAQVAFHGFPLSNARQQTGAIGIALTGNLWVTGIPGRGARQIDPRTELPSDLRARPATELAYRFSEQPFDLNLRVEPSPPLVRAASRTTVILDPKSAHIDTWLDFETTRGRLFDLKLGLPAGLQVESVGPADVVGSWQTGVLPGAFLPAGAPLGLRLLTVRPGARVQGGGKFSLHLVGRQAIETAATDLAIALFQPIGVTPGGGRLALLADPSLTVDLAERGDGLIGSGSYRPTLQATPADWPWPQGRAPSAPPILWLHHDDAPIELPLVVKTHHRSLSLSTSLTVRVDRREAEVQQQTECSVRFGTVDQLDITVPAALEGRWEAEGFTDAQRRELGRTPRGDLLFRLKLASDLTRSAMLRFRYRLPVGPLPGPDSTTLLTVPWIQFTGAGVSQTPVRATVLANSGLVAELDGNAWRLAPSPQPKQATGVEGLELKVIAESSSTLDTLSLRVSAQTLATLPKLFATRLCLRTVLDPGGAQRTSASYGIESHDSSLAVALPPGAELQRARVGGEIVAKVQQLASGDGIKVDFPANMGSGPILVELEYSLPAAKTGKTWIPPKLREGVVQLVRWEVRLPWSQAVVGVPDGWSDENEWYWDSYVWKRRPWMAPSALAAWVAGPVEKSRGLLSSNSLNATESDLQGDYHGYLFSRPGDPVDLPITVASRAWLVGICSGSVLAVGGLLILVWHPSIRLVWLASLVFGLSIASLLHPSVTFLAVQSAMIGVVLTALVALMQRIVERRRTAGMPYGDPGGLSVEITLTPSQEGAAAAGSDDSTAIRPRPISTLDHVITVPAPTPIPSPLNDGGTEGSTRTRHGPRGGVAT